MADHDITDFLLKSVRAVLFTPALLSGLVDVVSYRLLYSDPKWTIVMNMGVYVQYCACAFVQVNVPCSALVVWKWHDMLVQAAMCKICSNRIGGDLALD